MAKQVLVSQRIIHPVFGPLHIVVRTVARHYIARWKGPELQVTVPAGTDVAALERFLSDMEPQLLASRPDRDFFTAGWRYEVPGWTLMAVCATDQSRITRRVDPDLGQVIFGLPPSVAETGSDQCNAFINNSLEWFANVRSFDLVEMAQQMAGRLGVRPVSVDISRGQRTLGRCTSRGEVFLSRNLVFYPMESRRYVIAHEFAHLTHMDHSPAFHRLLDHYLDGREAELWAAVRRHTLPFKP